MILQTEFKMVISTEEIFPFSQEEKLFSNSCQEINSFTVNWNKTAVKRLITVGIAGPSQTKIECFQEEKRAN